MAKQHKMQFSLGLLMALVTGLCLGLGAAIPLWPRLNALPLVSISAVFSGSVILTAALLTLLVALRWRTRNVP